MTNTNALQAALDVAHKTYFPHLQQVSSAPKKKKKVDEGNRNALKVKG